MYGFSLVILSRSASATPGSLASISAISLLRSVERVHTAGSPVGVALAAAGATPGAAAPEPAVAAGVVATVAVAGDQSVTATDPRPRTPRSRAVRIANTRGCMR